MQKKLIRYVLPEFLRYLLLQKQIDKYKKIQVELTSEALNQTNASPPSFCHSGNYFLMTSVHNLYTASVVGKGKSHIFLPTGSQTET